MYASSNEQWACSDHPLVSLSKTGLSKNYTVSVKFSPVMLLCAHHMVRFMWHTSDASTSAKYGEVVAHSTIQVAVLLTCSLTML